MKLRYKFDLARVEMGWCISGVNFTFPAAAQTAEMAAEEDRSF
jgi:hypothetical protein